MTNAILLPMLLRQKAIHLCVDMQRMFAEKTPWHTPWMGKIIPNVARLVQHAPDHTIFTRFIPAATPLNAHGSWQRYYQRWPSMTLDKLSSELLDLVPEVGRFAPPAQVIDKYVYSPWQDSDLKERLDNSGVDTLIISGGETDVCVLATVMGAMDHGYHVILVTDALCSSCDETHEALLDVYRHRFSQQLETVTTETILKAWRTGKEDEIQHEESVRI
jgi:nicotinamidase-related amidase